MDPAATPEPEVKVEAKVLQPSQDFAKELLEEKAAPPPPPMAPAPSSDEAPLQTLAASMSPFQTIDAAAVQGSLDATPERPPMPKGVVILAVLTIVVAVYAFFVASSALQDIGAIIDLLIGVGLLMRSAIARKIIVVVSVISVVVTIFAVISFGLLLGQADNKDAQVLQSLQSVQNPTPSQQQSIATLKNSIETNQAKVHHESAGFYLNSGIEVALQLALIVYLTRPKVKAAFISR